MEILNQIVDQILTSTQLPQTTQGSQADQGQDGFDAMIRRKYQENSARKTEKKPEAQKAEKAEKAEKPTAGEKGEVEEPSGDVQALAAAMLLQRPAVVEDAELQPQTQQETVQPAVQPAVQQEAVLPELDAQPAQQMEAQPQEGRSGQSPVQRMEFQVVEAPETEEEAPVEQVLPEKAEQPQDGLEDVAARPKDTEPSAAEEAGKEAPPAEGVEIAPAKDTAVETPEKAEPDAPVELEAPEGPRDLAAKVLQSVVDKDMQLCVIQLKPENLGVVQVTFSRGKDGALQILMEAANPKTASLLEKNMGTIQGALTENLRGEVRMEVRQTEMLFPDQWDGHQGRQQQQQPQRQRQRQDQEKRDLEDFVHRLRLGLANLGDTAS